MDQGAERRQEGDFHRCIPCAARGGFPACFAENRIRPGERRVGVRYGEARHHNYWRSRLSLARDLRTPPPVRYGTLPSRGSLPCSNSRTIAVRWPSEPPPAPTPSPPFSKT